jgi:hypothetical protein
MNQQNDGIDIIDSQITYHQPKTRTLLMDEYREGLPNVFPNELDPGITFFARCRINAIDPMSKDRYRAQLIVAVIKVVV